MTASNFGPVRKRSTIAEEISERILTLIKEKELHPGDRLPPERELANMLGVSRPSLREALRALAIMNIIEMRQGDGTYISALEPEQLFEHLEFVFHLDKSTLHQLFEARKVLEVGCVALAAARIDDEALADLARIVAHSEESVDDAEAFLQADVELHETIIRATGNPMLARFMGSISQMGMASRRVTGGSARVRQASIEDHKAILAALEARDPDAARAAMLHHLDNVEKSLDFD